MKKRIIIEFEEGSCMGCLRHFYAYIIGMGFTLRCGKLDKEGYFKERWTK